jgi:hypothetical protein
LPRLSSRGLVSEKKYLALAQFLLLSVTQFIDAGAIAAYYRPAAELNRTSFGQSIAPLLLRDHLFDLSTVEAVSKVKAESFFALSFT